jgi:hypothetical protein
MAELARPGRIIRGLAIGVHTSAIGLLSAFTFSKWFIIRLARWWLANFFLDFPSAGSVGTNTRADKPDLPLHQR